MPSSRANTAVDLIAVGVQGSDFKIEFKPDRELYNQRESTVACAPVARRTAGDWQGPIAHEGHKDRRGLGTGV